MTWTRWGNSNSANSNSQLLGDGTRDEAIKQFKQSFRAKTGIHWENRRDAPRTGTARRFHTYAERDYEPESTDEEVDTDSSDEESGPEFSDQDESKLSLPVQRLVSTIFNQQLFEDTLENLNYDAKKLSLSRLPEKSIEQGYKQLNLIAELLENSENAEDAGSERFKDHTDKLRSLIPRDFGDEEPSVVDSQEKLRKEVEVLDCLSHMKVTEKLMKGNKGKDDSKVNLVDKQFARLGLQELVGRKFLLKTPSPVHCVLMVTVKKISFEWLLLRSHLFECKGETQLLFFKVCSTAIFQHRVQ